MRIFQLNRKRITRVLVLSFASLPLYAVDPIAADWNQVCRVAAGRELLITTMAGEKVEGFCLGIDVTEISVKTTNQGVVRIARYALSRLEMHRANRHQLRSLARGMRGGFRWGADALLTPRATEGAAAILGTLAWGATSAPFCVLGDLKAKLAGLQEIRPN